MSQALRLAGALIALLLLGYFVIVLFGNVWVERGLLAALVLVFGGLIVFAWFFDRRTKRSRAGLEDI